MDSVACGYSSSSKDTGPMSVQKAAMDGMISGIISGALTRCLTQPLDVLKVRMQLQVEKIANIPGSKYVSMPQTFTKIFREEGVVALWKGHVPAQAISIVYGAIQFPIYEAAKATGHFNDFFAGGIGGVFAIVFCQPIDMMRTRLIGQSTQQVVYNSLADGIRKLYRVDGIRGFFRGLTPACLLVFPQSAIRFQTYHSLKRLMSSNDRNPHSINLVAGFVSGLTSKGAVYPMDLAKRRMQIQGFEDARRSFGKLHISHGLVNCIWTVVRQEGLAAMYKGFVPSVLKSACVATLSFGFYETGLRLRRTG